MHQPCSQADYLARLDHARRRALESIMFGSIAWVVGLGLLFSIPFVFGFENPWRLIEHYPSFPIALFILMVSWSLSVFLVVGVILAYLPKRFLLSCPHCERLVGLTEDGEIRRTGCCPGCRMPIYISNAVAQAQSTPGQPGIAAPAPATPPVQAAPAVQANRAHGDGSPPP